ncbi:MAG TPA: hypothetical protein VFJ82_21735 [Longimicrobium sp.]|nr:hypothetical protein [Longimicrobium sp.]
MTTAAIAPQRPSRTAPALWLAATQAIELLSLVPWAFLAGFSYLALDRHTWTSVLLPWPLLIVVWLYPLVPVACSAAAWRAFRRGDARRAIALTTAPLALTIPLLAFAWYVATPVQ